MSDVNGRPADETKQTKLSTQSFCLICGKTIRIQIFKGTGVCSENCRKDRDNDHEPFQPVNLRIE